MLYINANDRNFEAEDNKRFLAAVQMAVGYYKDPILSQQRNLEKVIVVVAVNFAYINHLQNFKCFLDRKSLSFNIS